MAEELNKSEEIPTEEGRPPREKTHQEASPNHPAPHKNRGNLNPGNFIPSNSQQGRGARPERRYPERRSGFSKATAPMARREGRQLAPLPGSPLVLARDEHAVSRKNIDPDCLKVMRRLLDHGYRALLVGGAVRDLLLGRTPKDFDVGTDAQTSQVRALFRNSRTIGRRFQLNQVFFQQKIIEVSTFRQETSLSGEVVTLAKDNTYGDPESDAKRRDLTINGLFYDLSTFSVIDYVGGIADLRAGVIRIIGEPRVRFTEDPVRMLRVVRHAARTGFSIEEETYRALLELYQSIKLCPESRIFEEFQREVLGGHCLASFRLLRETKLLELLFPVLAQGIAEKPQSWERLESVLAKIDESVKNAEAVSIGAALAAMLIDNLPVEHLLLELQQGEAEVEPAGLLEYWQTIEVGDLQEESPAAKAQGAEANNQRSGHSPGNRRFKLKLKPQGAPTHRRRHSSSPLLRLIDRCFRAVYLPRRERERVEQLLAARLYMLSNEPSDEFARALISSPYFREALQFCGFTARRQSELQRLSLWREASSTARSVGKNSVGKRGGGEGRRKRHRRRRRR